MELLSWGIAIGAVLALFGLGFAALQVAANYSLGADFWVARILFALAGLLLAGRFIYWGITSSRDLILRLIVCFVVCGLVGIYTVFTTRYVNHKQAKWAESQQSHLAPDNSETRQYKIERLKYFIRLYEDKHPLGVNPIPKLYGVWLQDWETKVEKFLRQCFDESYAVRFREHKKGIDVLHEILLELLGKTEAAQKALELTQPKFVFPFLNADKKRWIAQSLKAYAYQYRDLAKEATGEELLFRRVATGVEIEAFVEEHFHGKYLPFVTTQLHRRGFKNHSQDVTDETPIEVLEEMIHDLESSI